MHTNAMPVRAFRLITSKQSLSKRHCHTVAYRRTSGGTERDRRESGGSAPGSPRGRIYGMRDSTHVSSTDNPYTANV